MRKHFLIFLFITFTSLTQAQVQLHYPEYITGNITIDAINKVNVSNFAGVTIEFVYKAKVLDDNNNVVIEMISDVVSNKVGVTDYAEEKLKGLKVIKNTIDISSYTGHLTFQSEIVHPQQHQSIIATARKEVFLVKGVSMTKEKKPLSDPKLVHLNLRVGYDKKFEFEDIYNKLEFQNGNTSDFCTDFDIEIKQNKKIIYKSSFTSLCLPPGKSKLTQKQRAGVKIITDNYKNRNTVDAIYIIHGTKDSGKSSSLIPNYNHTVLNTDYKTYKNRSVDLSFDFVDHTTPMYFPQASDAVVIFDKQNKVESIEKLRTSSVRVSPMGVDNPMGFGLYREDFNGRVSMSILAKDNFNEQQLSAYIAYLNQIELSQLTTVNSNGFKIIAPKQLNNNMPFKPGMRKLNSFTFCIDSYDQSILFQVYYAVNNDNISASKTIDIQKVLNSIVYNNVKLKFDFDAEGKLKSIQSKKKGKLKSKAELNSQYYQFLKYHSLLSQGTSSSYFDLNKKLITTVLDNQIKINKIVTNIKTPRMAVITPSLDTIRKYQLYKWDSIGVQFSHRAKKEYWSSANKKVMGYYYKDLNNTEKMAGSMTFHPDKEFLEKYPNLIKFNSINLHIQPEFYLSIEVARMEKKEYSDSALKAVVAYENSNPNVKQPKVIKIKSQGYEIFISEKLINIGRFFKNTNYCFIKSKKYLYQFQISGGFKSDIPHFLNSIEIEGNKLNVTYDDNEKLKNAEMILH